MSSKIRVYIVHIKIFSLEKTTLKTIILDDDIILYLKLLVKDVHEKD